MTCFDVIGVGVTVIDVLVRMPSEVTMGGKQPAQDLVIQGGDGANNQYSPDEIDPIGLVHYSNFYTDENGLTC